MLNQAVPESHTFSSMKSIYDYVIIGGGIVGLATAMTLGRRFPHARIVLLEKEGDLSLHQTGRNSGVIHSGIYYKPGSFKASFALAGAKSLVEFSRDHGIPHHVCGKVIVATRDSELPLLRKLFDRGLLNRLPVVKITAEEVRDIEPHVVCLGGIKVPTTGITDYRMVSRKFGELFIGGGGRIEFGCEVKAFKMAGSVHVIETTKGDYQGRFIINCAGLFSDRLARMAGADPLARIVPFRGEYFQLVPQKRHLVNTLVYPVPNPDFPFLGVHFTKMIDGSVHAGPNAVLALKREGYNKSDFDLRDFTETMAFPGFWKLIRNNLGEGLKEMHRSFCKSAFVHSLQRIIPEIRSEDLVPCKAGVRAQALLNSGQLVDDFLIVKSQHALHVCNAPSPAATAALEIGKSIVAQVA